MRLRVGDDGALGGQRRDKRVQAADAVQARLVQRVTADRSGAAEVARHEAVALEGVVELAT